MKKEIVVRRHSNSFALLIVAVLFFTCSSEEIKTEGDPASGTLVLLTQPRQTDLAETIDLNANTLFLDKEIVRATFPGVIVKVFKNIGDAVHVGDVLLQIKTRESIAAGSLPQLQADGPGEGAVTVTACSDGVMTALNYHPGDFVSEGEEIALIANPASLRISLNVPYPYTASVRLSGGCQVHLPDGRILPGTVQRILPSVDPVAQTQTFIVELQQHLRLPENLNLMVRLPIRVTQNALVIPRDAVLSNETQDTFWIMKMIDDSTAVRIDIEKGIENDSLIQVLAPLLDPHDQIISDGAYGLPDTAKVIAGR
jgi:multidrug efflux pump subunit AcrA (membrane-fusion protein)